MKQTLKISYKDAIIVTDEEKGIKIKFDSIKEAASFQRGTIWYIITRIRAGKKSYHKFMNYLYSDEKWNSLNNYQEQKIDVTALKEERSRDYNIFALN